MAELIDAHERDQMSRSVVTATEAARSLRRELKGLAGTMAAAVSRQNIVSILDKVRDGVPGHSVPRPGLVATLRARIHGLLSFAEHAGHLPACGNVMAGYRRSRKSKFERVAAQVNATKTGMEASLADAEARAAKRSLEARIDAEWLDLSMPGDINRRGSSHPASSA